MHETTVVIPIKSFRTGWTRLAGQLDPDDRRRMATAVARRVVLAAAPLPVLVVTEDPEVASWAGAGGATTLDPGAGGLDVAVEAALDHLASTASPPDAGSPGAGASRRVVIAHADLPLATDLSVAIGAGDDVRIVTDRHRDGTNVLSIPLDRGFRVAYGVGSAARHRAEAERLGLNVQTVVDVALSWDLDTPEDLDHPEILALLERTIGADR